MSNTVSETIDIPRTYVIVYGIKTNIFNLHVHSSDNANNADTVNISTVLFCFFPV